MEAIEALVAGLGEGEQPTAKRVECDTQYLLHRDVEGALQSSVRIGRLLFPRTHPDFVGMQVVASLLGGYFGSRLMQNLREQHGYTYGVQAAMINFDSAGYLAIATQVAREHRDDALMEILDGRRRIKERIERLNEDRIVAERHLERAYSALTTDLEREVFNALYREGETILEAISLLHYSKTHIYRQRERILLAIKNIPA
jgi:predicted Zn-dependent peptidase